MKGGNDDTIYRKLFPPRKLPHSFAALKIRTKMPRVKNVTMITALVMN